jgi:hypothetical protein
MRRWRWCLALALWALPGLAGALPVAWEGSVGLEWRGWSPGDSLRARQVQIPLRAHVLPHPRLEAWIGTSWWRASADGPHAALQGFRGLAAALEWVPADPRWRLLAGYASGWSGRPGNEAERRLASLLGQPALRWPLPAYGAGSSWHLGVMGARRTRWGTGAGALLWSWEGSYATGVGRYAPPDRLWWRLQWARRDRGVAWRIAVSGLTGGRGRLEGRTLHREGPRWGLSLEARGRLGRNTGWLALRRTQLGSGWREPLPQERTAIPSGNLWILSGGLSRPAGRGRLEVGLSHLRSPRAPTGETEGHSTEVDLAWSHPLGRWRVLRVSVGRAWADLRAWGRTGGWSLRLELFARSGRALP